MTEAHRGSFLSQDYSFGDHKIALKKLEAIAGGKQMDRAVWNKKHNLDGMT
jgi:hypothetical protein